MYQFLLIICHEIGINPKLVVAKNTKGFSKDDTVQKGKLVPSPCLHSLYPNTLLSAHPARSARPSLFLLSDQLLINVSALTPRGLISGGARDWRESPVHAPLLFMNGPKTGVDSGSLCVAQWFVTATTDVQALRDRADSKEGGLREER